MFNKTLHKINGGIDAVYMTTAGILFIVFDRSLFRTGIHTLYHEFIPRRN